MPPAQQTLPITRHLQHMHRHALADLNAQLVAAGVAQADEVLRTADEVREGVPFVEVLACSQSGGISPEQRCDSQEVTARALACFSGWWPLSHLLHAQVKTATTGNQASVTRHLAPAHHSRTRGGPAHHPPLRAQWQRRSPCLAS